MGWAVFVVVGLVVVLTLLLREPIAELRVRRRERDRERKRQWRRRRDAERAQRRSDRAMNRAKAAARKGPPTWQQVAQRQGPKCWLCGMRVFPDDRRRVDVGREQLGATYPEVDYIVPVEEGGTFQLDNVRIAHQRCRQVRLQARGRATYPPPKRTFTP
jgi:hypothetical protein